MSQTIFIYTATSTQKNGSGAWAATIIDGTNRIHISRYSLAETSNALELQAVFGALKEIGHTERPIVICSGAAYLVNGLNQWVDSWAVNNWINSKGQPVENQPLWRKLLTLKCSLKISAETIKKKSCNSDLMGTKALAQQTATICEDHYSKFQKVEAA